MTSVYFVASATIARTLHRVAMVFSVAAIGISFLSLFRMATGQMPPKRE